MIIHFLYLEYFPSEDLPDEVGFGDDDEVVVDFHFYYSVDGFDLYFLNVSLCTDLKLLLLFFYIFLHPL